MERLTHERVNGIKTGYWSAATKEVLVQKLAAYENTGYEPDEISAAIEQHFLTTQNWGMGSTIGVVLIIAMLFTMWATKERRER